MKGKSFLASIFVLLIFHAGCKHEIQLEDYADNLVIKSYPGESVKKFVGNSIYQSPDKYLFSCYHKLNSLWKYQEEKTNRDVIQSAEDMIQNKSFSGDCEDYSVLIMSFCRLREIDAFFCLGKNLDDRKKGHVWIEVPICNVEAFDNELETRITKNLSANLSLIRRNNTYYLSFISADNIKDYKLEYVLNQLGILKQIK